MVGRRKHFAKDMLDIDFERALSKTAEFRVELLLNSLVLPLNSRSKPKLAKPLFQTGS